MSGLASRIGRNALKLKTFGIKDNFQRFASDKTSQDKWSGNVKTMVGVGITVVSSVAAYSTYRWNKVDLTDLKFTANGKGKIIGDVEIAVGSKGTEITFTTDDDGKAKYKHTFEEYKDDQYKFVPNKGRNPQIVYDKDNRSVITFFLLKK